MGRRFVKDENGVPLWVPQEKRQLAFRVTQTITDAIGMEAVASTIRNPETNEEGLGLYLNSGPGEIPPESLERARELWLHFTR